MQWHGPAECWERLRLTWYPFMAGAWCAARADRGRCGRDRAQPESPGKGGEQIAVGLVKMTIPSAAKPPQTKTLSPLCLKVETKTVSIKSSYQVNPRTC